MKKADVVTTHKETHSDCILKECGASLAEYTIAVTAVILTCFVVLTTIGTTLQGKIEEFPKLLFG